MTTEKDSVHFCLVIKRTFIFLMNLEWFQQNNVCWLKMILIFTNMVIKCPKKDSFWIFRSILIRLLFSSDSNMVTFYFSTIKIFLLSTLSNQILNPYQIFSTFRLDTILELIETKFVNLNGMLTTNILFLVVNRVTAYFGNTKMKRLQLS